MNNKQFNSVRDLVCQVSESQELASRLDETVKRRLIVKKLLALRAAKGLSQKEIADKMGCSQSCVSKLENSDDDDLKMGEFHAYLKALGLDARLVIGSLKDHGSVNSVKFYAMAIRRELNNLAELAQSDEELTRAVAEFFGEAAFNLIRVVQAAADRLPHSEESGEPFIEIDIMEDMGQFQTCSVPPVIPRFKVGECAL